MGSRSSTTFTKLCPLCPPAYARLKFLREFLYLIVTYKFVPVIKKIGTKENWLADYVSRIFDEESHKLFFGAKGLGIMKHIPVEDHQFSFSALW